MKAEIKDWMFVCDNDGVNLLFRPSDLLFIALHVSGCPGDNVQAFMHMCEGVCVWDRTSWWPPSTLSHLYFYHLCGYILLGRDKPPNDTSLSLWADNSNGWSTSTKTKRGEVIKCCWQSSTKRRKIGFIAIWVNLCQVIMKPSSDDVMMWVSPHGVGK